MDDIIRKIDEAKAACQVAFEKIADVFSSLKECVSILNVPLPPPIHASTPAKKDDLQPASDESDTFYEQSQSTDFEPGAGQMLQELDLNVSDDARVKAQPASKAEAEGLNTSYDSRPYWVPKKRSKVVAGTSSTKAARSGSCDSQPYWIPKRNKDASSKSSPCLVLSPRQVQENVKVSPKKVLNSSYDTRPYAISRKNLKSLRGKARKCVEGHTCDSCSGFFANSSLTPAEVQSVTRHRGPKPPKTPPGYWNPGWNSPCPPPA